MELTLASAPPEKWPNCIGSQEKDLEPYGLKERDRFVLTYDRSQTVYVVGDNGDDWAGGFISIHREDQKMEEGEMLFFFPGDLTRIRVL